MRLAAILLGVLFLIPPASAAVWKGSLCGDTGRGCGHITVRAVIEADGTAFGRYRFTCFRPRRMCIPHHGRFAAYLDTVSVGQYEVSGAVCTWVGFGPVDITARFDCGCGPPYCTGDLLLRRVR